MHVFACVLCDLYIFVTTYLAIIHMHICSSLHASHCFEEEFDQHTQHFCLPFFQLQEEDKAATISTLSVSAESIKVTEAAEDGDALTFIIVSQKVTGVFFVVSLMYLWLGFFFYNGDCLFPAPSCPGQGSTTWTGLMRTLSGCSSTFSPWRMCQGYRES